MDRGDFFVHFMDLTEEELKKSVDDIITTRLEALLELALRMSTANTDPFKDDLKVCANRIDGSTDIEIGGVVDCKECCQMIPLDADQLEIWATKCR